jgi:hypothetical protein
VAEHEETATARYIASNVSTQLMLKTLFEIRGNKSERPMCDVDARRPVYAKGGRMLRPYH